MFATTWWEFAVIGLRQPPSPYSLTLVFEEIAQYGCFQWGWLRWLFGFPPTFAHYCPPQPTSHLPWSTRADISCKVSLQLFQGLSCFCQDSCFSALLDHPVFLHRFVHPTFQKVFFSYFMSPFLLIKWFQQKQKFPPPSTLTPSPIIQVQQSRLSQAAGDRGIAEGSGYLLEVRGFMVLDCFVWHVCEFSDVVFFMIFWIVFVRLLFDRFGGPTHYIRSGWCKVL